MSYKTSPTGGHIAAKPTAVANDNGALVTELRSAAKTVSDGIEFLKTIKSVKAAPRARRERFTSLGEQAQAVFKAERAGVTDRRLIPVAEKAAAGASVNDTSGGGFLVQTDFALDLVRSVYERSVLAGWCDQRVTMHPTRATNVPGVDESSRADNASRNGGALAYWSPEGTQPTRTVIRFKNVEFAPKKLIGLARTTNELLADVPMLGAHLHDVFGDELGFQLDKAIMLGTGAGVPLGLLNLPATIVVAKETGQATATVLKENIDKLWGRLASASRRRAIWIISEDIMSQLFAINASVGPGGAFTFQPPGAIPGAAYGTLYGRPIIEAEQSPTLGSLGDIVLADMTKYTIVSSPLDMTLSLHSGFDQDEVTFRVKMFADAKSTQVSPLAPYQGTITKSPFVTLAARP